MLILLFYKFSQQIAFGYICLMISINPKEIPIKRLHGYLLGSVAPRPICFASTINNEGNVNLSPYSFFNVFSANPPIMIFSASRRVRDNTIKHTLENVRATKEVVINIVSYEMVQQMSLSSSEYGREVNEFEKAGFTELPSDIVTPPRVAEAPVQFECNVTDIIALGKEAGAGNLIIAEVVKLHINENILDSEKRIDPIKIDLVARMGGNWYNRAIKGMFEVEKPSKVLGIGVDNLPNSIRFSPVLTGNDLGKLGNVKTTPDLLEITDYIVNATEKEIHQKAHSLLEKGKIIEAFRLLITKEKTKKQIK